MDIEKLVEQLKNLEACAYGYHINGEVLGMDCSDFEQVMVDAADGLSTIPALQAENEKLRETVDKYATAARAIALHLKPFCDESLPYDEMIADAARKASDELEQVKREKDAAVSDIETALAYGMKDCELCKNSQCYVRGGTKPCLPKWRGIQKDSSPYLVEDEVTEFTKKQWD